MVVSLTEQALLGGALCIASMISVLFLENGHEILSEPLLPQDEANCLHQQIPAPRQLLHLSRRSWAEYDHPPRTDTGANVMILLIIILARVMVWVCRLVTYHEAPHIVIHPQTAQTCAPAPILFRE